MSQVVQTAGSCRNFHCGDALSSSCLWNSSFNAMVNSFRSSSKTAIQMVQWGCVPFFSFIDKSPIINNSAYNLICEWGENPVTYQPVPESQIVLHFSGLHCCLCSHWVIIIPAEGWTTINTKLTLPYSYQIFCLKLHFSLYKPCSQNLDHWECTSRVCAV